MATGKLTPKQDKFCIEYVKTGNGVAAYKAAYAAEKMSDPSIHKEVKALLKNPLITPRITSLQEKIAKKAEITLESHLERLAHLSEQAEKSNQMAAAIAAEVSRGKAVGLYIEHVKLDATVKGTVSYKANMPPRS